MYKKLGLIFIAIMMAIPAMAQELDCQVKVVTPSIQRSDKQIFTSMQNSIFQFMNNRKWTTKDVKSTERINCNIIIDLYFFNLFAK